MTIFAEYAKVRTIISGAVLKAMTAERDRIRDDSYILEDPRLHAAIARTVIQELSNSGYMIEERPKT